MIKFNRFLLCGLYFVPSVGLAAGTDFTMAAQLLSAARNGNTRLVQNLINSGANVNYVDSTGLSVVCTAVMNNDIKAVQILQMYGADASQCDRQIKNYNLRTNPTPESGVFSGLSSSHKLVLGVLGAGAVIGGLLWATDELDGSNGGGASGGISGGGSSSGGSGGSDSLSPALTVPYSPAYLDNGVINTAKVVSADEWVAGEGHADFVYMQGLTTSNPDYMQNYLLISHGYNLFANQYYGQTIFRDSSNNYNPVPLSIVGNSASGGAPAIVTLITSNGINVTSGGSLDRGGGVSYVSGPTVTDSSEVLHKDKYWNYTDAVCNGLSCSGDTEDVAYDLSGNGTAIENSDATNRDNNIAKIVAGWGASGDLYGFVPYGTLTIYRTGNGTNNLDTVIPYYNYQAMKDALLDDYRFFSDSIVKTDVIANASLIPDSFTLAYHDISDVSDINSFKNLVNQWYGAGQGDIAGDLFSAYTPVSPIIVNSVGGYDITYNAEVFATFENYVPVLYNGNIIDNNFMSVVAVQHSVGTSSATTVSSYGDGTGSGYGKVRLSQWLDENDNTKTYRSRMCGVAGTGSGSVDPWCFAAPGDTAEYAVASMAGAVAALKTAFSYMSNQQIFNLLALTADGPYLGTNPAGGTWGDTEADAIDNMVTYLKSKYTISNQVDTKTGTDYLTKFKETFGYGLINLERATTPNTQIYYYANGNKGKILSADGKTYLQSVLNTSLRMSSVFGMRGATLPISFYDRLESIDGDLSVYRVWEMNLSLGDSSSYGLYMGDTLAELKTRDEDNTVKVGNLTFGLARSEKLYDDNMSGVDNLSVAWDNDRFGFRSEYQHYLTDGAGRFTGMANPVLSLASNAVTSSVQLKSGRFAVSGRGFVGNITREGLLENDPAVSANFESAKLGEAVGAESGLNFVGEKLSLSANVGTMRESNTVLGAMWNGMLEIHGADTNYVDSTVAYKIADDIGLSLRGTFAWTNASDFANGAINGLSELKSNSFAAALRIGNFDMTASMPLALTDGRLYYSYAGFSVDEDNNLLVRDAGEYAIDLTPQHREYRFNASYRHKFGEWTDGALGLIYRVNPNNTDAFGNESIFMMKLSHRLGI